MVGTSSGPGMAMKGSVAARCQRHTAGLPRRRTRTFFTLSLFQGSLPFLLLPLILFLHPSSSLVFPAKHNYYLVNREMRMVKARGRVTPADRAHRKRQRRWPRRRGRKPWVWRDSEPRLNPHCPAGPGCARPCLNVWHLMRNARIGAQRQCGIACACSNLGTPPNRAGADVLCPPEK